MRCTRIGSSYCGHMSTIICEYVTMHPTGIVLRATKQTVFVLLCNFPGNLSASRPNSFDTPYFQRSIVF